MERQDLLYYGKSQTGAFCRSDHVGAGFVIAFPYMAQFTRGYTDTVVFHPAQNHASAFLERHDDGLVFSTELHGVRHEVGDDLFDLVLIAVDDESGRTVELEMIAL